MSLLRKIFKKSSHESAKNDHGDIDNSNIEVKKPNKLVPLIIGAIIYIFIPIVCIVTAGISFDSKISSNYDHKNNYHLDNNNNYYNNNNNNNNAISSFFSTVLTTFSPSLYINSNDTATRYIECPKPLHIWLLIAGVCFLFNVPIVYLYQIFQKIQKKQQKKKSNLLSLDRLKLAANNAVRSNTKKTLLCTCVMLGLIVQPLNLAWGLVGLLWINRVIRTILHHSHYTDILPTSISTLYTMLLNLIGSGDEYNGDISHYNNSNGNVVMCDGWLAVISLIQCIIMLLSIIFHSLLIIQVIKTVKRDKDIKDGKIKIDEIDGKNNPKNDEKNSKTSSPTSKQENISISKGHSKDINNDNKNTIPSSPASLSTPSSTTGFKFFNKKTHND